VNAALNVDRLFSLDTGRSKRGTSRNEEVHGAKRLRYKLAVYNVGAFWCRSVISGQSIQDWNEASAELLHTRERMRLSSNILNCDRRGTLFNDQITG
jgi:hypothetical protein